MDDKIEEKIKKASLDKYDPCIDKDKWLELLRNAEVFNDESKLAMNYLLNIGGEATCSELAQKYGKPWAHYSKTYSLLGERVHKKTDCPLPQSEKSKWWPILFTSKTAGKDIVGTSILCLRSELKEALKESDLPDVDVNEKVGENGMSAIVSKIKEVLEHGEQNIVLTGAPGTGKTYAVKQYVTQKLGKKDWKDAKDDPRVKLVQFHQSYDYTDFIEGYRPNPDSPTGGFELKTGIFKEFCETAERAEEAVKGTIDNFDESWTKLLAKFEDEPFITVPLLSGKRSLCIELNVGGDGLAERTYEGNEYKADKWEQGKSKFFSMEQLHNIYRGLPGTRKQGHDNYRKAIVEYMKDAANGIGLKPYQKGNQNSEADEKYYFIIDEINRADLSKVFGEVMMCLEDGYRGQTVTTQYGSDFTIPNNVIIIGTMNDIDRSVESFDFALRRRFRWIEIDADDFLESTLEEMWESGVPEGLADRIKAVNKVIVSTADGCGGKIGLSKDYKIGAAYFKEPKTELDDIDEYLENIWETKINPLLKEYTRGYSLEQVEKFLTNSKEALLNPDAESSDEADE
ncbi:MAG: hypothetical protein Ta2B_13270 [Termitinemataceae bacterium]|nr:MAG: hypothetical protein Ta2B_13270 [Termitinemataceae bacterium]